VSVSCEADNQVSTFLNPQFKILEHKAELTSQKESQRWKLVSAKRQADDVLPPPEIPARPALQKRRKAIKAESAEMGRIQSVEGGFPAGVVVGASKAEVAEDLEAIGKEVRLDGRITRSFGDANTLFSVTVTSAQRNTPSPTKNQRRRRPGSCHFRSANDQRNTTIRFRPSANDAGRRTLGNETGTIPCSSAPCARRRSTGLTLTPSWETEHQLVHND
jgi:hypothetical protein